jgi:endonuclease III
MPKQFKAENEAEKIARARKVVKSLYKLYPDAKCSLDHETPFQLLIATMLSAQCTDARVNMTTPALFAKYPTAQDMAKADVGDLEQLVRSTGFYKNKAKNIKACSQSLVEKYNGQVPQTMDELFNLAGVGRKTANVVLGNAFGVPSMVVDTHVTRLSNRLGWVKTEDAVKIEIQLMDIIDKKYWTDLSHLLIYHGRSICMERSPLCESCKISTLCPKIGVVKKKAKG